MGDEQPPPPPTPQQSAPVPPAPAAPDAKRIELTVKSMMEGVPEQKLVVSPEATVLDVKNAIAERTDIAADRQMLLHNFVELKHDSSPLSEYGILQNTTLTLQLRLASGSKKLSAPQLMILTPASFEAGTLNELRSILMGKKPKAAKKAARTTAAANDSWTPEKQMEHQVTRNRMKELMKKRKSTRRHEMDTDSVIGTPVKCLLSHSEIRRSPAGAPTDLLSQLQAAASQLGGPVESLTDGKAAVREENSAVSGGFSSRELKLFYDPPETLQENLARRGDFYDPPTTMKELVELKERLVEESKTKCRVCKKRLPLSEQAMLCRCGRAFCATHRGAEEHQCDVDYKHTGRKKLLKENPKVDGGGARKAKTEEA